MKMMLAIFLGGGMGAAARHYTVLAGTRLLGEGFPYGTLCVNVLGSLLIGMILEGSALKWDMPLEARALLVTGFLGGFTTFSAFSMDFFKLWHTAGVSSAMIYALGSVVLSLLAVFAGVYFMRGVMA